MLGKVMCCYSEGNFGGARAGKVHAKKIFQNAGMHSEGAFRASEASRRRTHPDSSMACINIAFTYYARFRPELRSRRTGFQQLDATSWPGGFRTRAFGPG